MLMITHRSTLKRVSRVSGRLLNVDRSYPVSYPVAKNRTLNLNRSFASYGVYMQRWADALVAAIAQESPMLKYLKGHQRAAFSSYPERPEMDAAQQR